MTMHLAPVFFTTTYTKKRKQNRNPKLEKAKEEHDKWLKMFYKKDNNKKVVVVKPVKQQVIKTIQLPETKSIDCISGVAPKAAEKQYTGTRLVGIATLHKSNMVPVFRKEDAVEISSMRR